LNDVLTGTIPEQPGTANWWALLSPQGKIQAEGLIGKHQDGFYLDVAKEISAGFFKRMSMYKLRAKADIHNLEGSHFVGWSDKQTSQDRCIIHQDQRTADMGYRVICEQSRTNEWIKNEENFSQKRFNAGIVELGNDFATDSLFPHDIAMDLLGGIDFSKGCYVGQEVVSRMRHRGSARKRAIIISWNAAQSAQVKKGDEIIAGGKTVGFVGQVIKNRAVSIVRLDLIKEPDSATINGQSVTLVVPPWAGYDFEPDSAAE
jgi:folate-binding protein YgfZ